MSKVIVVAGGLFGSEGKGHVAAQHILRAKSKGERTLNIRVAGPNAGHTVIDAEGNAFPLRTVPVGAALGTTCAIAPGSEIDLPVLVKEMNELTEAGHRPMLFVSAEATILTEKHKKTEAYGDLPGRLGSTGKGIGACRADRIMRTAQRVKDSQEAVDTIKGTGAIIIYDWVGYIDRMLDFGVTVVIEGTQGYGLGLHKGYYPQCTSSDTRGIDFAAMAGVNPWHRSVCHFEITLATRVFPIRVAGNSGPLKDETTWEALGLPEERTTVTHKVRRVGQWDGDLIREAVRANGGAPTVTIALTMADQKVPEIEGASGSLDKALSEHPGLAEIVERAARDSGADVTVVTTSPSTCLWA